MNKLTALPYPDLDLTHLVSDSSNYAVRAALHQKVDNRVVPIEFFSKKRSENYSTFDRVLLAAYRIVLRFKPQIESRYVTLFTDHKPLALAFHKMTPIKSDKQKKHLLITEYMTYPVHLKRKNIAPDCLSRPVISVIVKFCDLQALVEQQECDTEIKTYGQTEGLHY